MVAPAGCRHMIVEGFRHQPQSPYKNGCIGAIAGLEVMVASWFRNLFERSSFVASGKARHNGSWSWCTIQCARGYQQEKWIPNAHQIGKHERGTVSVLYRRGTRPAQRRASSTVLTRLGYTSPRPGRRSVWTSLS